MKIWNYCDTLIKNGKLYYYYNNMISWGIDMHVIGLSNTEGQYKMYAGIDKDGYWLRFDF